MGAPGAAERGAAGPSTAGPPPPGYPQPPAGYPPQYAGGYPQQGYQQPPPAGYPQQQYGYAQQQQQQQYGYVQQPPPQAYYYQQQPKPPGYQRPPAAVDVEAAAASAAAAGFAERAVRTAFVRKVFFLVGLQLAITTGIACVFMFVKPVKDYVAGSSGQWVFWAAWALTFAMLIALMCSTTLRRKHPWNIITLFAFTAVMSVLVGAICAYGNVQAVLIAFVTTAGIVASITFIAFVIPFDLTKRGHVLAAAGMAFFVAILITIIVGIWYVNKWWYVVISCIGALLFSAFLLYDLQLVLGGKTYEISPDEYVFASVQIYLDIINIFLMVLSITNAVSN